MAKFIRSVFFFCLIAVVAGCASDKQQIIRLPPPEAFNPIFLKYKDLPGQKVMVVAIDPTGEWAFGFDFGKETLAEAATNAVTYCDQSREKFKVFTKGSLFAVNNDVIYYDSLLK